MSLRTDPDTDNGAGEEADIEGGAPVEPGADRAERLLAELNPPQREAVRHGEGPLLVLAGAGSGKTRVLAYRIAYLLATGAARPGEILAITFTNKAAAEMRERVGALVGRSVRAMWVTTFHSACVRMLRADAERLGYSRSFTIYDESDSLRMLKRCLVELGVDPKRYPPRAIRAQISGAKNKLVDAAAYAQAQGGVFEETVAAAYELYEKRMLEANAMDFDDLLVRTVNALELFEEVRERWRRTFRHVLVDEYQDTNHAQYRLLQLLTAEHGNLMVVGDEDQCLVEGTSVRMADGTERPIEKLSAGDLVMSCHGSADFRPSRVTGVYKAWEKRGIAITTRSGRRLVSTPEHMHFAGYRLGATPPLDTEVGGRRLLEEEGLGLQHPHHLAASSDGRRRVVRVTLCAERRGSTPMHRIALAGRDRAGRRALETAGFKVRPARVGSESWRLETALKDLGEAVRMAGKISSVLDVDVTFSGRFGEIQSGRMSGNSLPSIPAASVRPGMTVFAGDGGYDAVQAVERVELDSPVYDINVEGTHNFVANGLVTHNSIYGFRHADIRNILDFERDFPEAEVIKLEQNYRSTQTILSAANAVVERNRERRPKQLWTEIAGGEPLRLSELGDEHEEARWVAGEIERLGEEDGVARGDVAVFYRTNAMSRVLEDTLNRFDLPYRVIGGTKFYERAEIKDAVAYLSLLANPADQVSFARIVNSPRRGIGDTSQGRLASHANTVGLPIWEVAGRAEEVPGLSARAIKAISRFHETMEGLRARAAEAPVAELLGAVLHESGYLDALAAERTVEAEGRAENLEALVEGADEFDRERESEGGSEGTPLEEYLQQISLYTEQDALAGEGEESLITLMTLHNAKGLEYDTVFIVGCEDGAFPHMRALEEGGEEEERRLCYVGITRARRRLYMTWARERRLFGRAERNLPSRFIDELPAELTERHSSAPGAAAGLGWETTAGDAPPPVDPGPALELRTGDDIVHASFGEGVVTAVEPGGVVVVRFAGDGGERKLMADYAPIRRR